MKAAKWMGLALGLVMMGGAMRVPAAAQFTKRHLYDEQIDPKTEIADGLRQARAEHKRVILDFGGDWCGDCQVLDVYFHDVQNAELLNNHFVVVHVYIGHMDKNLELAQTYGVPISRGVPALAVLDSNGKLLHSQNNGAFADMRHMDPSAVHDFLTHWKG